MTTINFTVGSTINNHCHMNKACGPGVIITTQLSQFWEIKLAHQRCAKFIEFFRILFLNFRMLNFGLSPMVSQQGRLCCA